MIGTTLLHYRILEKLGAGGQGTVYKALNTKLNRPVVIKVLLPELAIREANLKRFEREARLASALDHPNICTIFDFNEVGGVNFIVMQYVEGRNVRQLVKGHPLELQSALSIAIQVADALAAAHARDIIHRDIKAGNVMVTDPGQVKVLDFGLAKLSDEGVAQADGIHQTQLTEIGVPYGTATYAAPEQASGDRVDKRADIFSTGVLLYEMLTGTWPFQGKTTIDVRHAVLHDTPQPVAEFRTDVLPPSLQQILDRALAKEPRDRYQRIEDLRDELKNVLREISAESDSPQLMEGVGTFAPRRAASTGAVARGLRWLQRNLATIIPGRARASSQSEVGKKTSALERVRTTAVPQSAGGFWLAVLLVCALLVGMPAIGYYFWTKRIAPPAPPQQHLVSTFPGSHRAASFSPDGQMIAFINPVAGVPQVWVKNLAQGDPTQITFGEDPADRPRWAPRNDQILYVRQSQGMPGIWSVPLQGGIPQKVIEGGRNPNWSWDGTRLVFERGYEIWMANADGSDQRKVEGVPPTDLLLADRRPSLSPDGSLIAFFQKEKGPIGDFWVVPAVGGQARRLTFDAIQGGAPAWTPDGRFIVFPSLRAGSLTLWKVPAAGGQPEPVLVSAGEDTDPEISRDGRKLIYTNTRNSYIVTLTDPATGQATELYESRTDLVDPSFSPQGDKILFFAFTEGGDLQLFTVSAEGGRLTQVTQGKGERNVHPHWSADGSAAYFYQIRPTTSFRKISVRGGDSSELVSGWEYGTQNGARIDPAGKRIIYSKLDKGDAVATMIRDIETGKETAFTILLRHPRWSHDGKFIVGTDLALGKWSLADITLCPLDGGPCRKLVRGWYPHWSADDSRIYFFRRGKLTDGEELWSVTREGADEIKIAELRPMHPIGEFFDVSPEGRLVWVQYRRGKNELWLSDFPKL